MAKGLIDPRSLVAKRANDKRLLNEALRQLSPSVKTSSDRAWFRQPALCVIDCVLSLNRNYDRFVVPRVDAFEKNYPEVRSIRDLKAAIAGYETPNQFMVEALNYRHEARAKVLSSVVEWLNTIAGDGPDSATRLELWAKDAKPAEANSLAIPGFGLAGFQYLRMLLGGNTVKPDLHICQYVSACVHRRVSATEALKLLEAAALETGLNLRDLDTTIWEASARPNSAPKGGEPITEWPYQSGQQNTKNDRDAHILSLGINDDTHLALGKLTAEERRAVEELLKDSLKAYLTRPH